jgi:hypothetical protein
VGVDPAFKRARDKISGPRINPLRVLSVTVAERPMTSHAVATVQLLPLRRVSSQIDHVCFLPFEISNHEKQKEKHAAIQFFRSLLVLLCYKVDTSY